MGTWVVSWNSDESKARMRRWTQPELEAAAELLDCYIKNGELDNNAGKQAIS